MRILCYTDNEQMVNQNRCVYVGEKYMKKILTILSIITFLTCNQSFADELTEAKEFFNSYVNAANTYSTTIPDFYSSDAKIIRQVVKPDGTLVDVATNTETYMKQLKLGQATAKLRKYKNDYRNINAVKVPNGYKVTAERQPSGETYWLKTHQIVQKQPDGKWKIVEEMMQTKVQTFLKYANK